MRLLVLMLLAITAQSEANAQRLNYFVAFPNMAHHEAQVSLVVSDLQTRTAVFRMSRSSPGRYATHEFGKNVYDVKAFNEKNIALTVTRTDGDVYEVSRHTGYIRLVYTIYGNYADGTYLGIDAGGIHINMPAMFMWLKGVDKTPITIHFDLPAELHWTIATQLKATPDLWTFTAPGLQYFMDCPTKIGDLIYGSWDLKNPDGKSYSFRIAYDAKATDADLAPFTNKIERIVKEEQGIFGEVPAYDFGTYTFLASINPYVHGDGMEHRNSTMISIPVAFHGDDFLLEVFAHEFFHCWNVKRIRPKTLEPFNFEKSNMSNELWFAEGFTQYYGQLCIVRAGFEKDTSFASAITGFVNTKLNTIGATHYSPVDASRHAVFVDAGVAVDKTNYPNMYTSYYPYGAALAMALDLELRGRFNKTLDEMMQVCWKKLGKPEVPYEIDDLESALATVTGDRKFAHDFFARFIYGHETLNYAPLLEKAGFVLKKKAEGKGWVGTPRFLEQNGVTIASNTIRETPLYEAGLDVDDKIVKVDDNAVTTAKQFADIISGHIPGDKIAITYIHRDQEKSATVLLKENPALIAVAYESAGLPVTDQILEFRKGWLGTKAIK